MAIPSSIALLDHFAALTDPRQHAKVLYPLLVLSATIAGANDFVETTLWGTEHLGFLRRFYRYESGIRATIRCATCSQPWTWSCSRPASMPGSAACAMATSTSSPLMGRPRGAATTGGSAAIRST